jgi:uncharacterized protein (DUF983 family)
MIFTWLVIALRWLLKLFIPPPTLPVEKTIDVRAKCPACGHRDGTIRAGANAVNHICNVCGASWSESPIVQSSTAVFTPKPEK